MTGEHEELEFDVLISTEKRLNKKNIICLLKCFNNDVH